ncbi:hypothetical protein SDC9_156081 [bioreactor metagenome]|uniref:Uncharacterized protein n=1 Tax=bioreactor metagenome TaxID=1076179 RepID=A0A645F599_9ZZZZ
MRQLRSVGDDAVVLVRRGEGQPREPDIRKERFKRLQHAHVGIGVRREDHRRAGEELLAGVDKSAALTPRHGVSADVGKTELLCDRGDTCANIALDPAEIDKDRILRNAACVLSYPVYRCGWANRNQN